MTTTIEMQRQRRCDRRERFRSRGSFCGRKGTLVDVQKEPQWRWLSVQQFTSDCLDLARALPCPIAGVAGVPRAGMFAAGLLSSWLNVPLAAATERGLVMLKVSGRRLNGTPSQGPWVLVEDDSWSGGSLRRAQAAAGANTVTAAVVSKLDGYQPDFVCRRWAGNWFCEHRFFSSWVIPRCAFDFDGILCEDCPPEHDDDGLRYRRFLENAPRKWVPRGWTMPLIATARREVYRDQTLDWLYRHGAKVDKMVMGHWVSLVDRTWEEVVQLKIDAFAESGLTFFVESCPVQADAISNATGMTVICPPTGEVFNSHANVMDD